MMDNAIRVDHTPIGQRHRLSRVLHCLLGALSCFVMVEPSPYDLLALLLLAYFLITAGSNPLAHSCIQFHAAIIAALLALGLLHFVPLLAGVQRLPFDAWFYGAVTAFLIFSGTHLALLRESEPDSFNYFIGGYILGACLSAIIAIVLIVDPSLFGPTGALLVLSSRPKALFKDPNVLGPYLVPAAIIAIELRYHTHKWIKRLAVPIFLLCTLGIAATSSRAAWLNLVLTMIVFSLISDNDRRRFMLFPVIALFVALGLFAFGAVFSPDMAEKLDIFTNRASIQEYDSGRFEGAEFALGFIDEYPLGVGPGHIGVMLGYEPHNTLVKLVVENGIPSLVILLGLFMLAQAGILFRPSKLENNPALRICTACVSGQFLNTAVVDALHWRHYWILLALGAMLGMDQIRRKA